MPDWFFHYVNDFSVFFGWLFNAIKTLIEALLLPIAYIFQFIKSYVNTAFGSPQTPPVSYTFTDEIMGVFHQIPYWETIGTLLGTAILLFTGVALVKAILRIT